MHLKQSIQWNKVTLLTYAVWVVHATYFVDNGPKSELILCVLDRLSVCSQARKRADCGEGGKVGPHQSMRLYFHDFCLFTLDAASLRSSSSSTPQDFVLFVCCESTHRSKVHSSSDNHTQNTHMHTVVRTYKPPLTHRGARVPPPRLARPLPAARTHIVSHRRPPHLIPSDWPPGSPAFSETFSHFLFLLLPVWISLIYLWISLPLFLRVHLLINLSLPILPFPFISGLFPQGRNRRSGAVLAQGQEPEPSPFGFHYKQASTSQKNNNQRVKKERKRRGLKGL